MRYHQVFLSAYLKLLLQIPSLEVSYMVVLMSFLKLSLSFRKISSLPRVLNENNSFNNLNADRHLTITVNKILSSDALLTKECEMRKFCSLA